jgi:exosortase family protein XrtG
VNEEWLAVGLAVYLTGLLALRRQRNGLIGYLWAAFGLAALIIVAGQVGGWNVPLGAFEAQVMATGASALRFDLTTISPASMVVRDPTGWSILQIGVECSALIELSVFTGLLVFYPRFTLSQRAVRLAGGLSATFMLNLLRLAVIVAMVALLGKPAVPWAHAIVGRMVFFVGVVYIYWRMLTLPTLHLVRRDLEVSGRAIR